MGGFIIEKYSFSKLRCFEECKYSYLLDYVQCCESCQEYDREAKGCSFPLSDFSADSPMKPNSCEFFFELKKENNAFAEYGTLVHSIMERFARGELPQDMLKQTFIDEFPAAITYQFPAGQWDLEKIYYENALSFFDEFEGFGDMRVVDVEDRFDLQMDDFILTGFIDLVVQDMQDERHVWDWKSKKKFKSKLERAEYGKQLYTYALWVKAKYGKYPKEMAFLMFRNMKKEAFPFDDVIMQEVLDWIYKTVSDIRSCEIFEPTFNEFKCSHLCNFRNSCPHRIKLMGGDFLSSLIRTR